MLNQRERHHVLKFFRYFSKLGVFPLQVNVGCWEIHSGFKSTWKKLACRATLGMFLAQTLYKNLSLAHVVAFGRDIPLHQMIIHMIIAAASVLMAFWYYVLHVQYRGAYAAFARVTLTATVTGSKRCSLFLFCLLILPLCGL